MSEPWLLILVDTIILITVLEWFGLRWHHRKTGRGVAPVDISLNLLSGLALMLALRFLLSNTATAAVVAMLLLAGVFHGMDLIRRWRR
jgi:uncharacterized membrane protein